MEYRHAYRQAKSGRPRLLTFVRKEVWDVREDRASLRRLLVEQHALDAELSEADRWKLIEHPSRFVTDAAFVFDFVREVGRVEEMKRSGATGARPVGNWVYQFSSFEEVADACRTVMRITGNLRWSALSGNLAAELQEFLALSIFSRRIDSRADWDDAIDALKKKLRHRCWDLNIERDREFFQMCAHQLLLTRQTVPLRALQECICSTEFLDYEHTSGRFVRGRVMSYMLSLEQSIQKYREQQSEELVEIRDRWELTQFSTLLDNVSMFGFSQSSHDRGELIYRPLSQEFDALQRLAHEMFGMLTLIGHEPNAAASTP